MEYPVLSSNNPFRAAVEEHRAASRPSTATSRSATATSPRQAPSFDFLNYQSFSPSIPPINNSRPASDSIRPATSRSFSTPFPSAAAPPRPTTASSRPASATLPPVHPLSRPASDLLPPVPPISRPNSATLPPVTSSPAISTSTPSTATSRRASDQSWSESRREFWPKSPPPPPPSHRTSANLRSAISNPSISTSRATTATSRHASDSSQPTLIDLSEKPPTPTIKAKAAASDLSLVIGGTYIYDISIPDVPLYEISQSLDVDSPVRIRSLILDVQTPKPRYQDIYSFSHLQNGVSHVIQIKGHATGHYTPPINIHLRPSKSIEDHRVWEIILLQPHQAIKIIQGFKFANASAPVMWRDGKGDLLALDMVEDTEDTKSRPMLKILQDRDEKTMDLLVVAWCARLWISEHEKKREQEVEREMKKALLGLIDKGPKRSILGIKW